MTRTHARVFPKRATAGCAAALLALGLAGGVSAQSAGSVSGPSAVVLAEAPAADTLRLLLGLGEIRADLQQAMLAEGGPAAAAPVAHARDRVWPGVKDAMLAAGVADLDPVLQKLAAGGGKDAQRKALVGAEAALMKARSVLAPKDADVVRAVTALAQGAAGRISVSGPTEAQDYQAAWAFLMVARGELDLLARSADPAMARLAGAEAMAIDEMFITLPHPGEGGAVSVDPTPILDLISRLQKQGGAA